MEDALVKKAYEFTELSLAGKKRYSGESFAEHGVKVAKLLERYHISDPKALAGRGRVALRYVL